MACLNIFPNTSFLTTPYCNLFDCCDSLVPRTANYPNADLLIPPSFKTIERYDYAESRSVDIHISGFMITPYFKTIELCDYVVRGTIECERIVKVENKSVLAFKIVLVDRFGQSMKDTLWIEPEISDGTYVENLTYEIFGEYYFALKKIDAKFYYYPNNPYSFLRIYKNHVRGNISAFDQFLIEYLHCRRYRKMKTEKFEEILKKVRHL